MILSNSNYVNTDEIKSEVEKLDFKSNEERKMKTKKVVEFYKDMDEVSSKKMERIRDCSNYLEFLIDVTKTKKRLFRGYLCRDKFCPICSKNLAMKNFIGLQAITNRIHQEYKKEFIFVTLTAPNVKGDKLKQEIERFNKAFNALKDRKAIKKINKGFVRKLEVTYNIKDETYHTHFHVLIAVNKRYFTTEEYIKRDKWLDMWQQVMQDITITQVDVRRVKDINKALLEISKYIAKDNDYLINKKVFKCFYNALLGKRMLTYGGLFKDGRKKFKLGELDSYINYADPEWKYLLSLIWKDKKYNLEKLKELTEEDLKNLNLKIKNEIKDEI